jgi:hypothetical protein
MRYFFLVTEEEMERILLAPDDESEDTQDKNRRAVRDGIRSDGEWPV